MCSTYVVNKYTHPPVTSLVTLFYHDPNITCCSKNNDNAVMERNTLVTLTNMLIPSLLDVAQPDQKDLNRILAPQFVHTRLPASV